jgi:hypothetical protein
MPTFSQVKSKRLRAVLEASNVYTVPVADLRAALKLTMTAYDRDIENKKVAPGAMAGRAEAWADARVAYHRNDAAGVQAALRRFWRG